MVETVEIYSSIGDFLMHRRIDDVEETVMHIWNNPDKYSPYKKGSEEAYSNFLKFLWVRYPDVKDQRLAEIACRND